MSKELSESQHHTVDERQQQVDGSASDQGPHGRGLVEDDG